MADKSLRCSVSGCRNKASEHLTFLLHPYRAWLRCSVGFCKKHIKAAEEGR